MAARRAKWGKRFPRGDPESQMGKWIMCSMWVPANQLLNRWAGYMDIVSQASQVSEV
jgi:hypothetical protein